MKNSSRTASVVEVRDRTTLLPGEAPALRAPKLEKVIDVLFALHEDPHDRRARIQLGVLHREGGCQCPACGDDVTLEGYRRTQTDYTIRDEWRCMGCRQRFVLAEQQLA